MIVFAVRKRKRAQTTNYRALFIVGLSFIPVGITTKDYWIWLIGLVFMIISLANRKEWKNERKWSDLTNPEKAIRFFMMAVGIILLIAGITLFFLRK
jgi:hypothetical protein